MSAFIVYIRRQSLFIHKNRIENRAKYAGHDHTQWYKDLDGLVDPFIDPMLTQHFKPDKYEHNGNALREIVKFAYGTAKQKE